MAELGERLRARRTTLGLSVVETARRADLSRTYLQRLERPDQDSDVSTSVLLRLANALECAPDAILPELRGGVEPRDGPALVAEVLLAYLDETEPDPRLVSALAMLGLGRDREASKDDSRIVQRAQELLFQPSTDAMFREANTALVGVGVDVNALLRAELEARGLDATVPVRVFGSSDSAEISEGAERGGQSRRRPGSAKPQKTQD
jgi:transcriptional regulator with XRE-family HTH domain